MGGILVGMVSNSQEPQWTEASVALRDTLLNSVLLETAFPSFSPFMILSQYPLHTGALATACAPRLTSKETALRYPKMILPSSKFSFRKRKLPHLCSPVKTG